MVKTVAKAKVRQKSRGEKKNYIMQESNTTRDQAMNQMCITFTREGKSIGKRIVILLLLHGLFVSRIGFSLHIFGKCVSKCQLRL